MEKISQNKIARFVISIITALYVLSLLYLTLLSRMGSNYSEFSLMPFVSWQMWFKGDNITGMHIVLCILGYAPLGIAGGFFFCGTEMAGIKQFFFTVITALCLSVGIEIFQIAFRLGYFEYDDMISSIIGSSLGYFVFNIINGLDKLIFRSHNT